MPFGAEETIIRRGTEFQEIRAFERRVMEHARHADRTSTRGHCYKLYKGYSQVNTHKYFFANRICDIWNALPSSVVEASSLTVSKRLLDNADLTRYFIDIR